MVVSIVGQLHAALTQRNTTASTSHKLWNCQYPSAPFPAPFHLAPVLVEINALARRPLCRRRGGLNGMVGH